jgi:alpha-beta hydrolase superfamily lysophospholipase
MTQQDLHAAVARWNEPEGLNPRGTVIILPGRGESPAVYERFGRRISADAYRVRAVADPTEDPALTELQVRSLLDGPEPVVLAGSDTGALFAAALVASGRLPEAAALVLAGVPTGPAGGAADGHPAGEAAPESDAWLAELEARTACPTHRGRLAGDVLRRGALYDPVPAGWTEQADLTAVKVPVLGLHGAADPVSALAAARAKYATAPRAELVSIAGGRHDAFNDITHRTVAATVILFLERLRNGAGLAPIAVREPLGHPVGARES